MSRSLEDAITAIRNGHNRSIKVRCPAHEDHEASLNVSPGTAQPVTLHCHAGCETDDILREAGLDWNEISKPMESPTTTYTQPRSIEPTVYQYTDEQGAELFQVMRFQRADGKKDFRQRHRDENYQWNWTMTGVRRVLYHLPEVVAAVRDGQVVWLVEGEKDVETLRSHGVVATCNPMGAGKWLPEYTETLRGAAVNIIADRDTPGRRHAREVMALLRAAECTVRTFETTLDRCKDITDHANAGGNLTTLTETTLADDETMAPSYGLEILDYIDMEFAEEEFVVPGTLAHEERVIVTGLEGHGKSTFIRQFGVMVAAGIHPFTSRDIPPKRVLVVDAENGKRQMQRSWRELAGLAARHGHPVSRGMLTLFPEYLNQPDLTTLEGRDWLLERVTAHRPDLITLGPIQNLVGRDVKDDDTVRKFKRTVDEARLINRSAVIMEHHAPHKAAGEPERALRPYGSSLFLKWPDFGYAMRPTEDKDVYEWQRTRYPRERTRQWPDRLRIGTPNTAEWPWEVAPPEDGGTVTPMGRRYRP